MKKVLCSGLTILVLGFLTVPAWAQKGGHGQGAGKSMGASGVTHGKASSHSPSSHSSMAGERSNKGGQVRGRERAREVQGMNTTADTERGFTTAPGLDKADQQAGKHTAGHGQSAPHGKQGNTPRGKGKGNDNDQDESKD